MKWLTCALVSSLLLCACDDVSHQNMASEWTPDSTLPNDIQLREDGSTTDTVADASPTDSMTVSDTDTDSPDTTFIDSTDGSVPSDDTGDGATPPAPPCIPDTFCDDGDPCTSNDQCSTTGTCAGTAYTCDDGRVCTTDTCLGNGDCAFDIKPNSCLIGNICYSPSEQHIQNDCVVCDPSISLTEWALAVDGTSCGEGQPCVETGLCEGGQCDGSLIDCTDENPCTDDLCDPQSGCVNQFNYDGCDDGDACTLGDACMNGDCTPGPVSLVCDDNTTCTQDICSNDGCIHIPIEGACDDDNACTENDICSGGVCSAGPAKNCDDGNLCTIDTCDIYIGCLPEFVASPCCIAGKSLCDDQDPCTVDACDETQGTCIYTPSAAVCDDDDPCTGPDICTDGLCGGPPLICDDANPCTSDSCVSELGGCIFTAIPGDCDDDNACTIEDMCIGGTCTGPPLDCNDNNPCTVDSCNPIDGCTVEVLDGPCDDFNLCTLNTVCTATGCIGVAVQCNDNNPCTNDVCNPTAGCQYQPIATPCDDGLDCSTGDQCISGQCVADTSTCGCIPTYSDLTSKLTTLLIGESGVPGQGLDVDGDPTTCAPAGQCSDGVDNTMSSFALLANPELSNEFSDGGLVLLFNHLDFNTQGQPYELNFFAAESTSSVCDVQTENCPYELDPGSVNEATCEPHISFDNAVVLGNTLKAGGVGYSFPFSLPVEGLVLSISMENAQIEAQVTYANGTIATMDGVLAGAVAKESFETAIDQIPDDEFPPEFPKETIKTLINLLITNDIDTNGDGTPDAASIGITFNAIQGTIVGIDL